MLPDSKAYAEWNDFYMVNSAISKESNRVDPNLLSWFREDL